MKMPFRKVIIKKQNISKTPLWVFIKINFIIKYWRSSCYNARKKSYSADVIYQINPVKMRCIYSRGWRYYAKQFRMYCAPICMSIPKLGCGCLLLLILCKTFEKIWKRGSSELITEKEINVYVNFFLKK